MQEDNLKKEQAKDDIVLSGVSDSVGCAYWVTPYLRYAQKQIMIDEQTCKYELRLQQMWQGQDGKQKWEWIEVAE